MTRCGFISKGLVAALLLSMLQLGTAGNALAQEPPEIGVAEGQMYPDFLLPALDGKLRRLSDYRGKKVLLFHFASW